PEELRMFKDSLRRFVNNELIPIERQTISAEGEEVKPEFLGKLQQRAQDLGIWMMEVPEEHGGAGLSLIQRTVVTEELSRTIALPARGEGITGPSVRHILYTLTGELKERYLLPVLRGEKKVAFAQTVLDNVRVPVAQRIGEEGGGFKLAQKWLGAGRIKHGARALGVAERMLEMSTSYAKQRSTFGRPLADRQATQWKLADMYINLQAA